MVTESPSLACATRGPNRPGTSRAERRWTELRTRLATETADAAGLALFRILFGLILCGAVIRFAAMGWIDSLYLDPSYHFTYLGFDWVRPGPAWLTYTHFAAMGLAALSLALGWYARTSAAVFCVLFTLAELFDKATYLNHYYLVSLLALLLTFSPSGAVLSLDARRRGAVGQVPLRAYWLLRAQVAIVYLYAGLAKLNADWLLAAQPLGLWLRARSELPIVGPVLAHPWTAYAMSWFGAVFDLFVVPALCWRRTRAIAALAAVVFHLAIWLLFPVGVFSFVMLSALTLFFDPSWPRRFLSKIAGARPSTGDSAPPKRAALAFACAYLTLQVLVPLRFLLYPGPVNWTEDGFRFSWRVMLVEKSGQVEYDVVSESPKGRFRVFPRDELTPLQLKMLATQPDMIVQFAHHLRDRFLGAGYEGVRVYADSWVAFNGRRSQRLVDPAEDLAAVRLSLGPLGVTLAPRR